MLSKFRNFAGEMFRQSQPIKIEEEVEAKRDEAIATGEALRAMTQTTGWKLVKEAIYSREKELMAELVNAKIQDVTRLQAKLQEGQFVAAFVESAIEYAEVLKKQIEDEMIANVRGRDREI